MKLKLKMAETSARTRLNLVLYESRKLANCAEKAQFLTSLKQVKSDLKSSSSAKIAQNEKKLNAYWYIGLTKTKVKPNRKRNRRDFLENESE